MHACLYLSNLNPYPTMLTHTLIYYFTSQYTHTQIYIYIYISWTYVYFLAACACLLRTFARTQSLVSNAPCDHLWLHRIRKPKEKQIKCGGNRRIIELLRPPDIAVTLNCIWDEQVLKQWHQLAAQSCETPYVNNKYYGECRAAWVNLIFWFISFFFFSFYTSEIKEFFTIFWNRLFLTRLHISFKHFSFHLGATLALQIVVCEFDSHGVFNISGLGWLVCWVLWHINPYRIFNAKSIFMQIVSSISNNSV